jgi:transposase
MTMGTKRTVEFRQEAVRVALTSGLTRKQVASDFRVGFSTLSRWVQQDRKTLPEPSVQSDLEKEVAMLRKKSQALRHDQRP